MMVFHKGETSWARTISSCPSRRVGSPSYQLNPIRRPTKAAARYKLYSVMSRFSNAAMPSVHLSGTAQLHRSLAQRTRSG